MSYVVVGMVDHRKIDTGAPIASAFSAVGAGWASALVSVAAVAGLTSVILVNIVASGRIGFAMSRDGLLPPAIGALHPKWGTPYRVTMVFATGVALLAGLVPLASLTHLVSIGTLLAFFVVSLAVPLLRRTRPELKRPFRGHRHRQGVPLPDAPRMYCTRLRRLRSDIGSGVTSSVNQPI